MDGVNERTRNVLEVQATAAGIFAKTFGMGELEDHDREPYNAPDYELRVVVNIERAEDLRSSKITANPYVNLRPSEEQWIPTGLPKKVAFTTKVKLLSHNPTWKERFVVNFKKKDSASITFCLKHRTIGRPDEKMGIAVLDLSQEQLPPDGPKQFTLDVIRKKKNRGKIVVEVAQFCDWKLIAPTLQEGDAWTYANLRESFFGAVTRFCGKSPWTHTGLFHHVPEQGLVLFECVGSPGRDCLAEEDMSGCIISSPEERLSRAGYVLVHILNKERDDDFREKYNELIKEYYRTPYQESTLSFIGAAWAQSDLYTAPIFQKTEKKKAKATYCAEMNAIVFVFAWWGAGEETSEGGREHMGECFLKVIRYITSSESGTVLEQIQPVLPVLEDSVLKTEMGKIYSASGFRSIPAPCIGQRPVEQKWNLCQQSEARE